MYISYFIETCGVDSRCLWDCSKFCCSKVVSHSFKLFNLRSRPALLIRNKQLNQSYCKTVLISYRQASFSQFMFSRYLILLVQAMFTIVVTVSIIKLSQLKYYNVRYVLHFSTYKKYQSRIYWLTRLLANSGLLSIFCHTFLHSSRKLFKSHSSDSLKS